METNYIPEFIDKKTPTLAEKILFPVCNPDKKKLDKILKGKTILITGASFGIGAALASKLSHFNCTLLLIARTTEKLNELQQAIKSEKCNIFCFTTDLRDEGQVKHLVEELVRREFKIDVLINNAGKSINRNLVDSLSRYHDTSRCSATNFTGPVQLLLGMLPVLFLQRGHIINVSAINVLLPPTVGWSAYQSSKVAFDQWLKCAEPELKARNVKVSSLYFPIVRTRMSMANKKNARKQSMSRDQAANIILRYILSGKRKYKPWWTGAIQLLNFIFPDLWFRIQVRHYRKVFSIK